MLMRSPSIHSTFIFTFLLLTLLSLSLHGQKKSTSTIPHLAKSNDVTQLMVDDKAFLILGGELHNSSASSPEHMSKVWGKMKDLHINTVIAPVYWELTEPEGGKFDFTLTDELILGARANDIKLVVLWFGSWKNGYSTYAPGWVKKDIERFSRVKDITGNSREILSVFDEDLLEAERKAFVKFMKHLKTMDGAEHTVIMVQIENEVGILKDSRDRSELAEVAYAQQIPEELISYLNDHKESLLPEISDAWSYSEFLQEGSWKDVFGPEYSAEEIFMAWHYASYMNELATSGKEVYPLPMFVNAWGKQSAQQKPGGYPSGGPISAMIDIYRAAGPQIDFLAPDIYGADFKGDATKYTRSGNPLFIPETRRDEAAADRPFWVFGEMNGLGLAPFGIDNPEVGADHPMQITYALISDLQPYIAEAMGTGKMHGFLETDEVSEEFEMGDYVLRIQYQGSDNKERKGAGLVIQLSDDEFLFAGRGYNVKFRHIREDEFNTALYMVEELKAVDGKLKKVMTLNGDETYGGTMLKFPSKDEIRYSIQKASVYTYPATRLEGYVQASYSVLEHPGFEGVWKVKVEMGPQGNSEGEIDFTIEGDQYKGIMRTPEYEVPFEEVTLTKEGIRVAYSMQGFNIVTSMRIIDEDKLDGNVADIYPLTGSRVSGPEIDPKLADALEPFLGTWNVEINNTPEGDVNGILSVHKNLSALTLKGEVFMVSKVEVKDDGILMHLSFQGYDTSMSLGLNDDQTLSGILSELYVISGTR